MIHIVGLRSGGVEGVPCPCHSVHCHCQGPLLYSITEKIAKLLCIIIAAGFTTRTFLFGGPAAQTVRQLKAVKQLLLLPTWAGFRPKE